MEVGRPCTALCGRLLFSSRVDVAFVDTAESSSALAVVGGSAIVTLVLVAVVVVVEEGGGRKGSFNTSPRLFPYNGKTSARC